MGDPNWQQQAALVRPLLVRPVFADTFADLAHWVNLTPNTKWEARDGRLIGAWAPGGSTLWCKHEFLGDIHLRIRAQLLPAKEEWVTPEQPDGGKNLNVRFHVTGPNGEDILDVYQDLARQATGPNRIGDDQYRGYFFTWTWAHSRLRRSPGYEMISETLDNLPQVGPNYTIEILHCGGRILCGVNGEVLHSFRDYAPFEGGRIGIALWHSRVAVDSIEVFAAQNQ